MRLTSGTFWISKLSDEGGGLRKGNDQWKRLRKRDVVYISNSNPYALHVIPLWCACAWYPCALHVIPQGEPLWCPCDTHVFCMWYPCAVHVVPMCLHVILLWNACDALVFACDTHVFCMWYQCGVPVIHIQMQKCPWAWVKHFSLWETQARGWIDLFKLRYVREGGRGRLNDKLIKT